jgi:hypothetical protein
MHKGLLLPLVALLLVLTLVGAAMASSSGRADYVPPAPAEEHEPGESGEPGHGEEPGHTDEPGHTAEPGASGTPAH